MSDAGLPQAVSALTAPITKITDSVQAWLTQFLQDTNMNYYAEPVLLSILLFFLFIHFLVFVLTNNTGIQNFSKGFSQTLFETQAWLQTVVIKLIIYYGSFMLGLIQGASNSGLTNDVVIGGVYFALLFFVYILNKTCVIFTGVRNPEYTLGPAGQPTGIFTSSKNKALYTPTIWVQTVTDILIQQSFPGAVFGYVLGKVIVVFRGGDLRF
jgi:hypothetical protein